MSKMYWLSPLDWPCSHQPLQHPQQFSSLQSHCKAGHCCMSAEFLKWICEFPISCLHQWLDGLNVAEMWQLLNYCRYRQNWTMADKWCAISSADSTDSIIILRKIASAVTHPIRVSECVQLQTFNVFHSIMSDLCCSKQMIKMVKNR